MQHTDGHTVHRTRSYTLTAEVAAAVDFVSPTVQLPTIRTAVTAPVGASEPKGNTPKSLRTLYNVGTAMGGGSPKTKQAVTAFLGQLYVVDAACFCIYMPALDRSLLDCRYSAADLASFYKQYWPTGDAAKIKVKS